MNKLQQAQEYVRRKVIMAAHPECETFESECNQLKIARILGSNALPKASNDATEIYELGIKALKNALKERGGNDE